MGHFGFYQLIKNYAEINLLIDKKIISQEDPYAAQKSLRSPMTFGMVNKQTILAKCVKLRCKV